MLRLKLGFVWGSGRDARLRVTVQPVARVEGDVQRILALRGCLLHEFRTRYPKAVIGHSERVGVAQICRESLTELFSNGIRQRRFRLIVDA
jgi:hypothetical protein